MYLENFGHWACFGLPLEGFTKQVLWGSTLARAHDFHAYSCGLLCCHMASFADALLRGNSTACANALSGRTIMCAS